MPFDTRLADAFVRVGSEIKAVRDLATGKYTKPASGIPSTDLATVVSNNIIKGLRWEQEILVQPGTRGLGLGSAPLGIYIPFDIAIVGIRFEFETATTSGTSVGKMIYNKTQDLTALNMDMSIPQGSVLQQKTLAVSVPSNSRLSFELTNAGTSGIGKGLYIAMWGNYA